MPNDFNGRPGLVAANLPTTKNISSTTNATPIVITTSAAHGLIPGDFFFVEGATDTNANGVRRAGTVTSTTVVALELDGSNTVGAGGGGAAGTLFPITFGAIFQYPADNEDADESSIADLAEPLGDRTAYLYYAIQFFMKIRKGGLFDALLGSIMNLRGEVNLTSTGVLTALSGAIVTAASGSMVKLLGRVVPRSARVAVADGNKTIAVRAGSGIDYAGKRFVLPSVPASPRTITLEHTNSTPEEGETIEVIWLATSFGGGSQFTFKRESGGVDTVAAFVGSAAPEVTVMYCCTEFEFVSGVWRLGATNGFAVDSTDALFGVVPGTHA